MAGHRAWSLPFVLVAYALTLAWMAWQSLQLTEGTFAYAQDDPYIHLTLARTLATHGVWGLSPDSFAGASSSPLWTAVLALLMAVSGPWPWWPLVINTAAGAGLLFFLHRCLPEPLSEPERASALLIFMFALPLPTLVFVGMEHTLHTLVVLALCVGAARRLSEDGPDRPWPAGLALAAAAAGLRYEGLFVVAVVAMFSALRGRWKFGVSLAAVAAVPLAVYAAYAVANGGWLLPNSVVIKSGAERFGSGGALLSILGSWLGVFSIYQRPAQLALLTMALAAAALVPLRAAGAWSAVHLLIGMFAGVELLHVWLVRIEWFFRYEAYVVALGMTAVMVAAAGLRDRDWSEWAPAREPIRRAALTALVALVALPLCGRAFLALARTPLACAEIYRQQYQMAGFFGSYYAGKTIAINDIGAVSWFAPVEIVDLIGLASTEIAASRRAGRVDAEYIRELVSRRGVGAIAVYESHFEAVKELPPSWVKVGEWTMPSSVGVHAATVAFFAPDADAARTLSRALEAYATRLPRVVAYAAVEADRLRRTP